MKLIRTVYYGCDGMSAGILKGYYWIPDNLAFEGFSASQTEHQAITEYVLDHYGDDISWRKTLLSIHMVEDPEAKINEWRQTVANLSRLLSEAN